VASEVVALGPGKKELWRVARLHDAIASGEFDEDTVRTLFAALREHAPKNSVVREFGDFIAHRDKDRGPIHEYVAKTVEAMERQVRTNAGSFTIAPVHTVAALGASLSHALAAFGRAPLSDARVNEVAVCLISLSQHVRLTSKEGAHDR